ncbi:MAG: hypothetical protein FJ218_03400 [Ignavibacteria bacterium]|nr:hypothetical protein [Ignavibacteria bacterium]
MKNTFINRHIIFVVSIFVALIILTSCEKKFDFSTLPLDENISVNETSYVELAPPFSGFQKISSIAIGGDQMLYVADYNSNKIFQLNVAGIVLGELYFNDSIAFHPSAIVQDSRLDLLFCGETKVQNDTIAAIFRIQLSKFGLKLSEVTTSNIKTVWKERAKPARRFKGIIVVSDNQYIVARVGPDNSSPIDPDSRIIWFQKNDAKIKEISDLQTGVGSSITFINKPTGIIGFPFSKNFIVTQTLEGVIYGAVLMKYSSLEELWIPGFDPSNPLQRVDFIRPNQFTNARGGAYDAHRGDVFIVNATSDTNSYAVFKFDSKARFKNESIRPNDVVPMLTSPSGAAFYDRVLYVAQDSRIFRFKLSTDFIR